MCIKTTFTREKLTFTYLAASDIPEIAAMLAKESVCEFLFFGPNTEAETRAYFEPMAAAIAGAVAKGEMPAEHVFTIRQNGVFLGQAGLLPIAYSPGNYLIGFTLDDLHWRRGHGEAACRFLVDFGLRTLRASRISGDCASGNIGSRKIMERCGFQFEGCQRRYWHRNGRFCDNLLFGLVCNEKE